MPSSVYGYAVNQVMLSDDKTVIGKFLEVMMVTGPVIALQAGLLIYYLLGSSGRVSHEDCRFDHLSLRLIVLAALPLHVIPSLRDFSIG